MIVEYPILESKGIIVNKNKYSVTVNDTEIYVTKMLFEMLHFFISNIDKAITRDDFLNYVWKNEHVVERTIDVHIKKLRDIVGKDKIETLTGIGYIWKSN
jgi:two-component system alkaline phosphatase synthesis response regulator PhoP